MFTSKKIHYVASQETLLPVMDLFVCKLRFNAHKANTKIPTPYNLITDLAYRYKPHHKRIQYLRARLGTYANVDIMPACVYKLVCQDPDSKRLAPSKLEIGTYTTDTVKLVGSCMFYLVYPDTKHLLEVTFYVASKMTVSCYHG